MRLTAQQYILTNFKAVICNRACNISQKNNCLIKIFKDLRFCVFYESWRRKPPVYD